MKRWVVFSIFVVGVFTLFTSGFDFEYLPSAEATKSQGNSHTAVRSNQVCGEQLCSVVNSDKPHINEITLKNHTDVTLSLLFLQTASSGTFTEENGKKILTLNDISSSTVWFSDRPQRITGHYSTDEFVLHWNQDKDSFADDPPNAALEILSGVEESDVFILELSNPIYDSTLQTLQYEIILLEEGTEGLSHYTKDADVSLLENFGVVALFIDNESCGFVNIGGGPPGSDPTGCDQSSGLIIEDTFFCLPGPDKDLRECDYSDQTFSDVSFENSNLSGVNLSNSVFRNVDFDNANLSDTNFSGADIRSNIQGKVYSNWSEIKSDSTLDYSDDPQRWNETLDKFRPFDGANLDGANLDGANLSGSYLKNVDFSNANLKNVDFSGSQLNEVNFANAKLYSVDLSNAELYNVNLSEADLDSSILTNAHFNQIDFSGSGLQRVSFHNIDADGCNFGGLYLDGVDFSNSQLDRSNFRAASLQNANFHNSILDESNTIDADFTNANFAEANVRDTDLSRAILDGVNFQNADLSRSDLTGLDLRGVDFSSTKFVGATLKNTNLQNANFKGHCEKNNFIQGVCEAKKDYKLNEVNFQNADLRGVNFIHAHLDDSDFTGAKIDDNTRFNDVFFTNVKLQGVNLDNNKELFDTDADFRGVIFSSSMPPGTNLEGKDFTGANFRGAVFPSGVFDNAVLVDVNFINAGLSSASFQVANLTGIDFSSANLRDANLSGADLTNAKFSKTNTFRVNWDHIISEGCTGCPQN